LSLRLEWLRSAASPEADPGFLGFGFQRRVISSLFEAVRLTGAALVFQRHG
jgi:hypothetical protein